MALVGLSGQKVLTIILVNKMKNEKTTTFNNWNNIVTVSSYC
jgi:hypothetical protein